MKSIRILAVTALSGVLAFGVAACGDDASDTSTGGASSGGASSLSGNIKIDGSVFPFAQAAAEQFRGENSGVDIAVGESGTGGGFEKFCAGETDISNASRPIKDDEEAPICKKNAVEYSEVQVANDGIAIVTNKDLKIDCMTTDQLKMLWNKTSKIANYSEIDPKFPDQKVALFGAGTDSGTFDFFTDEINGEEGASRSDYSASEDDNVIIQGVAGTPGGLGYFGFSYYEENQDKLKALEIDGGSGCVAPSVDTAQAGAYTPLSRPLYVYAKTEALERQEVDDFLRFMLENETTIAEQAQYVPLNQGQLDENLAKLDEATS